MRTEIQLKDFTKTVRRLRLMNLQILVTALSFLPAFCTVLKYND